MITADLHAHTSFSSDSEEPMENALSAMVEKGLKTVCFTEHMDMDYPGGSAVGRVRPGTDRKSTRLNSSHDRQSRMPSSA